MNNSIITHTGRYFSYDNISEDNIHIDDIIHSLPRINRFVGHSIRPYSVGEHSIYCYLMSKHLGYTNREQLLVLMHDFTEAYIGDCPSPLKKYIPEFNEIEDRVENAIYKSLKIDMPTQEEVAKIKDIDITMLMIEMIQLTNHKHIQLNSGLGQRNKIYTEFFTDFDFALKHNKYSKSINYDKDVYNDLNNMFKEAVNNVNKE